MKITKIRILKNPIELRSYLIVSAIFSGGLMTGFGYALLDEFLMWVFIIAFFLQHRSSNICNIFNHFNTLSKTASSSFDKASLVLFLYLLVSTLITCISTQDWRLLRWAVLYGGLLVVILLVGNPKANPKYPYASLLASCLYFLAWMLHWMVLEWTFNIRWEEMQAVTWSGSTYAAFPAVIALPAALLAIKGTGVKARRYGWLTLVLCGVCAQLYSSRILIITMLAMIPIVILWLPWRKTIAACIVIIFSQFSGAWLNNLVHQLPLSSTVSGAGWVAVKMALETMIMTPKMGVESVSLLNNPRISDLDRHAHLACAADFLSSRTTYRQFFGHGQDRHKQILLTCPAIKPFLTDGQTVVRSTAAVAMIINHGILGIILIILCVINNLIYLFKSEAGKVVIPFFVLALCWGLITDYRDHLLIWFIISLHAFHMKYVSHDNIVPRNADIQFNGRQHVG